MEREKWSSFFHDGNMVRATKPTKLRGDRTVIFSSWRKRQKSFNFSCLSNLFLFCLLSDPSYPQIEFKHMAKTEQEEGKSNRDAARSADSGKKPIIFSLKVAKAKIQVNHLSCINSNSLSISDSNTTLMYVCMQYYACAYVYVVCS